MLMLSSYNAVRFEDALRDANVLNPPFPAIADRAAWAGIRMTLGESEVGLALGRAEAAARAPIPVLPATLYLEFMRNGERQGYERPGRERRERMWSLAIAECLEADGRFLDPLLDYAWAICEESSWAWPAHQRELTDAHKPIIDLAAAMTALELAELDMLLGARLEPALGARIRAEVDRRCLTPYLARHDHWWLHGSGRRNLNNWTAVCNGGVVGAALYLEPDPARLAEILARAMSSLDEYLATFDPTGGSAEGPGYWSFGFGYYTILAHLIEHRTGGRVSLLESERVRQIAQFPLRAQLSPGRFANFSDCDRHISLTPPHLVYLGQRLDVPGLVQLASLQSATQRERGLTWGLRSLVWRTSPEQAGAAAPAAHDWFEGQMWMLARQDPSNPAALVLAAKGGHNGEPHNQNDVGSIIVHVHGESVVADPGRGRYTRFYFGPERYDHFVNSSRGHSVPVPNGHTQRQGMEYAAELLHHASDHKLDQLTLELKRAYAAEADLTSLRRTISLHRETPAGRVELVDEAGFASGPGNLESVLITFGQVQLDPSSVVLKGEDGGLRVRFEQDVVSPRVEVVEQVDLAEGPTDVKRVVFALRTPSKQATIRLQIDPY